MSFLHTLWQRRRYITATNWVKSLWFNIAKLPLKQGIKLPVLLSRHVKLKLSGGGVLLDAPSRFGMVLLGYEDIPTQDNRYNRMSVFVEKGSAIVFKGSAKIGGGTQLLVRGNSQLVLGDDFYLSLNSSIYCYRHIEIGDSCTIGWNVLIMDTDWHQTFNSETKESFNIASPVRIGNHCWICNNVHIQKGTELPNNVIVAAKSLCNKKYDVPEYSLIAGTPAKLKKESIGYDR